MRFAHPIFFLLFILIAIVYWGWRKQRLLKTSIKYSGLKSIRVLEDKRTRILTNLLVFVRYLVFFLIVIALARPQGVNVEKEILTEGVDIMLAIDVSGSMRAEDFRPENRLVVAKKTVKEFIKKRQADRIGLVVFGGEAFTQCPLTLDYSIVQDFLDKVEIDMAGDGTAIGMAIATALNRIKASKAKTKIIVLLTDGVNNTGEMDPLSAASLAESLGVKVYTIGVGKEGGAPIPVQDPIRGKVYARNPDGSLYLTEIDEETLKKIALLTKAQYFRAVDEDALKKIYEIIDKLEKTKIKTKIYHNYEEYFPFFTMLIFILLGFEVIASSLFLQVVP